MRRFIFLGISALSLLAVLVQLGCGTNQIPGSTAKTGAAAHPASSSRSTRVSAAKLSFNEHVQPILAENCYACHGTDPSSRKAELRLDRAEHAFKAREKGGPAIIPGQPDKSPLVARIESKDVKEIMPPPEAHKTLNPAAIALLRRWIAEGAEYQEHWAFIAPVRPALPEISAAPNPVDRFVLARLAAEKIVPSPEADRPTLLRRVTYDLTGLPPTPAEAEAFLADAAPGAYERVVDRLLASPRYGEHRARYWLDYVRYADTHGIHFDNYRAIWPYRDYVIRAFNQDKPFDRFVREQLAGDLLPARTLDELAATGLIRCNLTTNEGGTISEEVFVNQTRDRVEAFGATFLGLTTGCAACHDHKFDPFSQRDFYGLAAFLNNTVEKPWDLNIAEPAPVLRLPTPENAAAAEQVFAARAATQEKIQLRRARASELTAVWLGSGNRPKPVATTHLELRLKLDEGKGDVLKNSARAAKIATFKAETNPLVWGENNWLWPAMRMDILTRINLGDSGDVEADEAFSAGSWIMLRANPGGGVRTGTGNGTLLARMGDAKRRGGAGWDISQSGMRIIVSLTPPAKLSPAPSPGGEAPAPTTTTVATEGEPEPPAATPIAAEPPSNGLQIATKLGQVTRDEWRHLFVTYDGSRQASGLKIYLDGKLAETEVRADALAPQDSIRTDAAMHLGRRDDFNPMRETRFQDVRFYRRHLTPVEVARLPFEDLAAEIVAREPSPAKWSTDEKFIVADRFFLGEVDPEMRGLSVALAEQNASFEKLTKEGTATLIAAEKETPAFSDILKRGDYFARGERVEPAVPHFLNGLPAGTTSNRRGLAEWLLAPTQPLMARVTVNRMWQELFGRGLVESAGDFGIMGDRPSHPQLLDWLAVEFRESGWEVKKFYRMLVTSATYRRSAAASSDRLARDPSNKLLSRGPRFRMDAEMLRDSALATAGLLVEKIGGPPVKPYQPPGIWEEVAMPESNTKSYVPDKGDGLYRRSVYTFWKRASAPASLETFDATSREVACTRRARTNTPLQAFVTMNDPQWVEAARKLAERAVKASPLLERRLDFLARVTLARPLAAKETAVLTQTAQEFGAKLATREKDAKALIAIGDSPADATIPVTELAQWTLVASQFLNLDEFLTK